MPDREKFCNLGTAKIRENQALLLPHSLGANFVAFKTLIMSELTKVFDRVASFRFEPDAIARWFIQQIDRAAGDRLSLLKLQKLLYYAQAWALVYLKKSLFEEDFEAWSHGPVLPSVWDQYKAYRFESIPAQPPAPDFPEEVALLLKDIQLIYGEKSAKFLEELIQQEDPWILTRGSLPPEAICRAVIEKGELLEYYQALARDGE